MKPGHQIGSNSRILAFIAWSENLVRCYREQLSDAERQALQEWESRPDFPDIGDWPGWLPYIGPCPTSEASPVLRWKRRHA